MLDLRLIYKLWYIGVDTVKTVMVSVRLVTRPGCQDNCPSMCFGMRSCSTTAPSFTSNLERSEPPLNISRYSGASRLRTPWRRKYSPESVLPHLADMLSSNILSLPFRKGTHLSLSTVIRNYINAKYDQHPEMFRNDLEIIDDLRRDAVNVREPHPSGVIKLQKYAAQLVWISGKFPIDVSGYTLLCFQSRI